MPNMFAIKTLKGANTKDLFFKEADMLAKFNKDGIQNVRLLAKIIERTSGGGVKYSLLFPWAEKDLAQFWEETQRDEADIRWIAEQCHCLANALSFIHNPCFLDPNEKQLFGRHGDIKPENVLWFKNNEGAKLAFSDMGLAEVRKDSSRSNIPGENIPRSPTYRPPECEMAGTKGHISRSFDIWTLGCVFLEFVVWILEGPKGITDFHSKLRTPYINSLVFIHIFFSMSRVPDSTTEFAFQVHENVTEVREEIRIMTLYANKFSNSGSRSSMSTRTALSTSTTSWT